MEDYLYAISPRLFGPVIASYADIKNSGVSITETVTTVDSDQGKHEYTDLKALSLLLDKYADTTFAEMVPNDFLVPEVAKRKTRYRYIFNGCGVKIDGKPKLNIRRDDCDTLFICEQH